MFSSWIPQILRTQAPQILRTQTPQILRTQAPPITLQNELKQQEVDNSDGIDDEAFVDISIATLSAPPATQQLSFDKIATGKITTQSLPNNTELAPTAKNLTSPAVAPIAELSASTDVAPIAEHLTSPALVADQTQAQQTLLTIDTILKESPETLLASASEEQSIEVAITTQRSAMLDPTLWQQTRPLAVNTHASGEAAINHEQTDSESKSDHRYSLSSIKKLLKLANKFNSEQKNFVIIKLTPPPATSRLMQTTAPKTSPGLSWQNSCLRKLFFCCPPDPQKNSPKKIDDPIHLRLF
jgi:hypothetical protein